MKKLSLHITCLCLLWLVLIPFAQAENRQSLQGSGASGPNLSADALRGLLKTPNHPAGLVREPRAIDQTGIFWDYCQGVLRYPDGITYCFLQYNEQWLWTALESMGDLLLACGQSQNLCGFNVTTIFSDGSFLWDLAILAGQ